jgi:hypothetical protein
MQELQRYMIFRNCKTEKLSFVKDKQYEWSDIDVMQVADDFIGLGLGNYKNTIYLYPVIII